MTTEQERVVTVVRDALDDLAQYEPDEIVEKLKHEGMLWHDPGRRSTSCPIHHWIMARLKAHGFDRFDYYVAVGTEAVRNLTTTQGERIPLPEPVAKFIGRYDRGDFKHLEGTV